MLKTWSATQVSIALSSGEAEYYGVVRAAAVGLGQQALFRDAGIHLPLRAWTDSSAAIGTASRQGLGKLRHVDCHSLWLQQRLRRKELELRKVNGEDNPADLFTKHADTAAKLQKLIGLFGCEFREGRAASAPSLRKLRLEDGLRAQDSAHTAGEDASNRGLRARGSGRGRLKLGTEGRRSACRVSHAPRGENATAAFVIGSCEPGPASGHTSNAAAMGCERRAQHCRHKVSGVRNARVSLKSSCASGHAR